MRKKAIITGGSRGIGAGIALRLAEAGYDIAISYASSIENAQAVAETAKARFGAKCFIYQARLEVEGKAESFIRESIKNLGGVDLLVNNAIRPGLGGGLLDIDTVEMDEMMRANLRAPIICSREVARYMAKYEIKGSIIMISSMRAVRAMPNSALYSCFKAAMNQMVKCICLDLAPFGIRVNTIMPGATDVRTHNQLLESGMTEEDIKAKDDFTERIPLARKGVPDDIAQAVLYLVSDNASYVTGAELMIDGGLSIPGFPEVVGAPGTDSFTWGHIKKRSEWTWADQY